MNGLIYELMAVLMYGVIALSYVYLQIVKAEKQENQENQYNME